MLFRSTVRDLGCFLEGLHRVVYSQAGFSGFIAVGVYFDEGIHRKAGVGDFDLFFFAAAADAEC